MLFLIIVLLVIGLVGLFMVNKVGNYENHWGAMMVGGLALFFICVFGWAGYGLFHLLF